MATLFSHISRQFCLLYKSLSPERVLVVWVTIALAIIFLFVSLLLLNEKIVTYVPALGGSLKEGILGTPRYINPILATSDQDKDLTSLVFAGLMKHDMEGSSIPDIASSIEKSEDGLKYTVTLKPWARFHDGEKVTADDVLFTVRAIQDPLVKSPLLLDWEGVRTEKIGESSVVFTLKRPYPQFVDALTVGILPKHLWKNLSSEEIGLSDYNIHAIGAGPFAIDKIILNSGIPKSFTLKSNKYYTLGRPYLNTLIINSYQNEKLLLQALSDGIISRAHGISPEKVEALGLKGKDIVTSPLPRTFTLFLNPNKADFLADKDIRKALDLSINKEAIVQDVYKGYAHIANSPYPFDGKNSVSHFNVGEAKDFLSKSTYVKKHASTTLELTITIGNTSEAKQVATLIQENWKAIGVNAIIEIYEFGDLNQKIIKERDFETVLVGTLVRYPEDLYAFWHSSQRKYPGLNISSYASTKLDANLEAIRNGESGARATAIYNTINEEFDEENPSIFLYTPSLIYIKKDSVVSIMPKVADNASSRFALIHKAYLNQEKIWRSTYNEKIITKINEWLH